MPLPRVCIASPAPRSANNGNSHTAARWADYLSACAEVQVIGQWRARRAICSSPCTPGSQRAPSNNTAPPGRRARIVLVLTGTDLYHDLPDDAAARRSLELANTVVVLQPKALERLPPHVRTRARVIEQSAPSLRVNDKRTDITAFVAVGHLRDEKRPLTLMRAARRLIQRSSIRIEHIGDPLDKRWPRRHVRQCGRARRIAGWAVCRTPTHGCTLPDLTRSSIRAPWRAGPMRSSRRYGRECLFWRAASTVMSGCSARTTRVTSPWTTTRHWRN